MPHINLRKSIGASPPFFLVSPPGFIGIPSGRLHNLKAPAWTSPALFLALPLLAYFATVVTIRLAARLTAWEAAYRGFRLPHTVVLRALYYHSADILPVALTVFVTCAGYNYLLNHLLPNPVNYTSEPAYLYTLCGEVIFAAGYLFNTYWIGMRVDVCEPVDNAAQSSAAKQNLPKSV